jgi:hypothetical protein
MSPIGKYFKGKGQKVMANMQDHYGEKKGEQVFHATANKNPEMKPAGEPAPKRKSIGQRIAEGG